MRRPVLASVLVLVAWSVVGAIPAAGQAILYTIQATAGDLVSGLNRFGVREEATNGLDDYDAPEPPVPPQDYLSLAFAMDDPSVPLPNRWRADIRNTLSLEDKLELWELHVESDQLGTECVAAVDIEAGAEFKLKLRVLGLEPGEIDVPVPGSFSFVIDSPLTILWLELSSEGPVPSSGASWGAVKSRFR